MDNIEELYYALGELCYAIAKSTGFLSPKDKDKLHHILKSEFTTSKGLTDPTEIVFNILQREGMDSGTVYGWAIHEMKLNSQYMSEKLKAQFVNVIRKVVEAFPLVSDEEQSLLDDFVRRLKEIKGDPVFSHLTE